MPSRTRVLDVGCSTGYLGELLRTKGCSLVGIEVDPNSAAAARSTGAYEDVHELNLNNASDHLPNERFDVVLCADVLEHLEHPDVALERLSRMCNRSGRLVISLPNVAHLSIRLQLLGGRFSYTETGILDRTHLHLYTYRSAIELLQTAGLSVEAVLAGSNRFGNVLSFGPRPLRRLRGLLAFNIVLVARPVSPVT